MNSGLVTTTASCLSRLSLGRGQHRVHRSIGPLGFTLIELLTTLAVASVLMSIAVPGFSSFVQNSSLTTQANILVSSLNFARSEAVKRDVSVSICPSTGALSGGQPSCDASSWAAGWIIYQTSSGIVTTLQVIPRLKSGILLNGSASGASVSLISYRPDGGIAPVNGGTTASPITFQLCDNRGSANAVSIEITAIGRPQASQLPGRTIANTALSCS